MGILKNITDEYFGETLRKEDGKFIDIDGCRVVVPTDYDEWDFIYKVDEVMVSMYTVVTKKKKDGDEFTSFRCGNGKWWMNIESYEYFRENTSEIEDFDIKMYGSIVKFLEYFMKDISIVKPNEYCEYIELLDKDRYKKIREFFKNEGVGFKTDYCFVEMTYDFCNEFSTCASFSRDNINWHSGEGDDRIMIETRDDMNNLNIYRIRWGKKMTEWWDRKFKEIEKDGVVKHFNIKSE